MTILDAPATASNFRVKVGRYGDRWYTDPLPTCPIAEASDWQGPSFSIVKGASGKDWTFVGLKRVAHASNAELARLPTLDRTQRYDTLRSMNQHGLSVAAGRGTIVHWWAEDMLHGRPPRKITPDILRANRLTEASYLEAKQYGPALRQFFDTYQPELVGTEYVGIHRTLHDVGYGLTPDGIMKIEGELCGFDWKSRSPDSDHGAYPEEAAQIAAGARASYMIVEGADLPVRQHIPAMSTGLVLSVKPESVRIYPVDINKAYEHFVAMHAWWCARRNDRDGIGRVWPMRKNATERSADNGDTAASPPPSSTVDATDGGTGTGGESDAAPVPPSVGDIHAQLGRNHDEGATLTETDFAPFRTRFAALTPEQRDWLKTVTTEAARAGVDFRAQKVRTARRYHIYNGLLELVEGGHHDPEVVRGLVAGATGSDAALHPSVTVGHAVGALHAVDAETFVEWCQAFAHNDLTGVVADDGHIRFTAA